MEAKDGYPRMRSHVLGAAPRNRSVEHREGRLHFGPASAMSISKITIMLCQSPNQLKIWKKRPRYVDVAAELEKGPRSLPIANDFSQKIVPFLKGRALRFGMMHGYKPRQHPAACARVGLRSTSGSTPASWRRVENVRRRSCNVQRGIFTPALASLASSADLLLLHPENPVPLRPKTPPSAFSGLSGSAAAIAGNNGTS